MPTRNAVSLRGMSNVLADDKRIEWTIGVPARNHQRLSQGRASWCRPRTPPRLTGETGHFRRLGVHRRWWGKSGHFRRAGSRCRGGEKQPPGRRCPPTRGRFRVRPVRRVRALSRADRRGAGRGRNAMAIGPLAAYCARGAKSRDRMTGLLRWFSSDALRGRPDSWRRATPGHVQRRGRRQCAFKQNSWPSYPPKRLFSTLPTLPTLSTLPTLPTPPTPP